MAKSCGIRIGPKRYELVVLDGSAKKHRITAFKAGEFPASADPAAEAARILKEAAKTHSIPHDSVGVAIDSGLAAFRSIKLPFADAAKIDEVIKFEVESQLPQWAIDDVVVDWAARGESDKESDLLVTALPKSEVRKVLDVCSKAGIEPLEVEIEATAMVNAAMSADICHVDDAQVLVHIGEGSTAVVVVDGGRVRSMRAIHLGALSHDNPAAEPESSPAAEGSAAGAEGAPPAPVAAPQTPEELQRLLEHAVSRIRRELGRTVSGARTSNPIEAIYVCGIELPDLIGTQVLDLPVYELDVFEADSGQPLQGASPLVVAYGAALRQLGAVHLPASLRREELKYTGAFERIELPLAVASLLLVTLLAVFVIFETKLGQLRDGDIDLWRRYVNLYIQGDPAKGQPGDLEQVPKPLTDYLAAVRAASKKQGASERDNPEIDPDRTRLEQLKRVYNLLTIEVDKLDKALGNTGEVTMPQSALEALTLSLGVMTELGEEQVGRVGIRKVKSQYLPGRSTGADKVEVAIDFTFFAADSVTATQNFERYCGELRKKPWVIEVEQGGSKSLADNPADNRGIYTESFKVRCDLSKVERKVGA
ncbi:MAG: pilus assembly protein PilM [Planctomycetes bacterium]|jgi:Tfp pilus assembly PilM family ATPase|nr:pilus assembly protein PilM [Planctomycetota bacterium]